jgi:selenocysteine lyase/cysteine desulfurase
MDAVLTWLDSNGVDPKLIHAHVRELQALFLDTSTRWPGRLVPEPNVDRGNFLTFQSDTSGHYYQALHDRKVITDYRGDRLRIGFGIYHDQSDVERLVEIVDNLHRS